MATTEQLRTVTAKDTDGNDVSYVFDSSAVTLAIDGFPHGKNLLSIEQFSAKDIGMYIEEAYAAARLINDYKRNGINLLPRVVLKAVMRQPSTRTGGTMTTAIRKLGGEAELISGMSSSSEAKGETLPDSWVAFATQSDIIGTRTEEEWGPALAAHSIKESFDYGKLRRLVPVINLGDGINEHPTQALGDLFTIHQHFSRFEGLRLALVGDHERYRAHHSLMLGAAALGMEIVVVESSAAPVPPELAEKLGNRLVARQEDLDSAMEEADVLYLGRNPDEYTGNDADEAVRRERLKAVYEGWVVDYERLQKMDPGAIVMHPRPRKNELHPSVDRDGRMKDVGQMEDMIAMRMAIIALHLGKSIIGHA